MTDLKIQFESWWRKRCPEFDPITTKHVEAAYFANIEEQNTLAELLALVVKRFPVESGLEEDEWPIIRSALERHGKL